MVAEASEHSGRLRVSYETRGFLAGHRSYVPPRDGEAPHYGRANILVNAGTMMLFRPATQEEISMQCLVKESDYLKPESAKRYAAYRNNYTVKPASFEADLVWEANYMNAVLAGLPPPMPRATIINTSLRRVFREATPPRTLSPHSARPAPAPSNLPHEEAPVPPSTPRTSSAAASLSRPTVSSPIPKAVTIKKELPSFRRGLSGLSGFAPRPRRWQRSRWRSLSPLPQRMPPQLLLRRICQLQKSHQAALWMWSPQILHMIP